MALVSAAGRLGQLVSRASGRLGRNAGPARPPGATQRLGQLVEKNSQAALFQLPVPKRHSVHSRMALARAGWAGEFRLGLCPLQLLGRQKKKASEAVAKRLRGARPDLL